MAEEREEIVPAEAPERNTSLRDALSAAYDKVVEEAPKEKPETPKPEEAPKIEAEAPKGPTRDPATGKFTKGDVPVADPTPEAPKAAPDKPVEPKPLSIAPASQAPVSWSPEAKAAWGALPPNVQQAIAKREAEVAAGFDEYRPYKALKPFAERAEREGSTLEGVLTAYTGIQDTLVRDPRAGFAHIATNLAEFGAPREMLAAAFAELANEFASSPGARPAAAPTANGAHPAPDSTALTPLWQEINSLKSTLTAREQAERQARESANETAVERMRADPQYPHFAKLEESMADLFARGVVPVTGDAAADLAKAYKIALRLDDETFELSVKERLEKAESEKKAKAEQARKAAVSLKGSPEGVAAPPSGSRGSLRKDLEASYDSLATQI